MDESSSTMTGNATHEVHLDRSRRELEKKIEELQETLTEDLERLESPPSQLPRTARAHSKEYWLKRDIDVLAQAYQAITAAEPFLPFAGSALPAILALRSTDHTIKDSGKYISARRHSLGEARERLEVEQANLNDQKALTEALEGRIQSLRHDIAASKEKTPEQIAKEKIAELNQNIEGFNTDTAKLMKALKKFIDEPLAAMLAAEQIGGPIAGDILEVDSGDLENGFGARGKRKKSVGDATADKRQRRIDHMVGMMEGQPDQNKRQDREVGRKASSGEEMLRLTEELMNSLMDAEGSRSDAYVSVTEETAAVRFLLRSNVAEFHPGDSKRLRLVDFGREIEG